MNSKLLEHLRGRQIAPILEESNEKCDGIALKVMTIIDHKLEERGVYAKIKEASDAVERISQPDEDSQLAMSNKSSESGESSATTALANSSDKFGFTICNRTTPRVTEQIKPCVSSASTAIPKWKRKFPDDELSGSSDSIDSLVSLASGSDELEEFLPRVTAPKTRYISKLLKQLLSIKLFGKFHFFKYVPPIKKFNFILKCRHCSLIGPYYVVSSHMALSHGTHVGSKQCQWCKASDLEKHIANKKLEECYKKYLEKECIDDPSYPSVIITFYEMIESLAEELEVVTTRRSNFNGEGKPKKEKWFYDGIHEDVVVHRHRRPTPIKRLDKLDKFFIQAISAYYGNNRINEFMPKENHATIDVDGQENGASSGSTPRRTRKRRQPQSDHSNDSQVNNGSSASVPGTSSKRSSMNFGRTIDEFIENIPSDDMRINAKLKVQAVVLKFSKKAYEERVNHENE